ncbi:MAG TPA: hypothetical protein DDY43_12280 [Synechococcales bacterium UBA10510]|nr:hypothetical protein [Synechococcales bacterium UBA10510]
MRPVAPAGIWAMAGAGSQQRSEPQSELPAAQLPPPAEPRPGDLAADPAPIFDPVSISNPRPIPELRTIHQPPFSRLDYPTPMCPSCPLGGSRLGPPGALV